MPAERLSMRKVKEVVRLSWGGKLSIRSVARSCDIGRTTVRAFEFFGGSPELVVPDYVPRNIIRLMCPETLCVLWSFKAHLLRADREM